SFLPTLKPFMPGSTRSAVTPLARRERSVVTNTVMTPACEPLVTHIFEPFTTYRSPLRTAAHASAAESDPEPASDSENAAVISPVARRGRKRRFCSALPARLMG